jgi:hypothetical protein
MNEEMIQAVDQVIAKQIMAVIPGLTINNETGDGWSWWYRKAESDTWLDSPLDALIDFTQVVLEANDRLTGGDISYDE